mgnify:CR=1 FL=1
MKELSLDMVVPYENLDRVYSSKFFKYDKKYIEQSQKEFGFRYISHVKEIHCEAATFENGKAVYKPVKENETKVHRVTVYPCVKDRPTAKGYEALVIDPFEKMGLRVESLEDARRNKKKSYKILIRTTAEALKKTDFKLSDIVKNTDKVSKLEENGSRVLWCAWDEIYQTYVCHKLERGEDGELHEVDVFQQAIGNILDEIEFQIIDPWNAILEEGNEAGYYRFKE